jgi:hypothetical protein
MRSQTMATSLLVSGFLFGCGTNSGPKPVIQQVPQANKPTDKSGQEIPPAAPAVIDTTNLPKEGPGDPTLTYDLIKADPGKYRGKRVTFAFAPLSSEGKRMMCGLDMNAALGPDHAGIYVVEFPSDVEAGEAFNAVAFQAGSTVTATVAGQVDQFLVVRDAQGTPQQDIPKVTVPLLVFPTYKVGK